jgi:hypothetical protein
MTQSIEHSDLLTQINVLISDSNLDKILEELNLAQTSNFIKIMNVIRLEILHIAIQKSKCETVIIDCYPDKTSDSDDSLLLVQLNKTSYPDSYIIPSNVFSRIDLNRDKIISLYLQSIYSFLATTEERSWVTQDGKLRLYTIEYILIFYYFNLGDILIGDDLTKETIIDNIRSKINKVSTNVFRINELYTNLADLIFSLYNQLNGNYFDTVKEDLIEMYSKCNDKKCSGCKGTNCSISKKYIKDIYKNKYIKYKIKYINLKNKTI